MTSRSSGARWRLIFCLAFSALFHLLIFRIELHHGRQAGSAASQASIRTTVKLPQAAPAPPSSPRKKSNSGQAHAEAPSATTSAIEVGPSQEMSLTNPATSQDLRNGSLSNPYYSVTELTQRPSFDETAPEEDIADLPDGEHSGRLTISLYIDASGRVERQAIEASSFTSAQEQWLLDRLQKLSIKPGELNGMAVPTKWVLEFTVGPAESPEALTNSSTTSIR